MVRKSGEIWISKTDPHTLKYYAGGIEYWATSATTYIAGEDIKKGQVLSIKKDDSGAEGKVLKASWPDDMNDVIGIALNDALNTFEVRVVSYGYIALTRAELEEAFVTQSDITVGSIREAGTYYTGFGTMTDGGAGNGWDGATLWSGNGAPIYWYQGRILKTGASSYEMQQPTGKEGFLTTSTPAGYKYPDADLLGWDDQSFDVSYERLPVIGNIYSYAYSGSEIVGMIIHVNFTRFTKGMQFSYPASGLHEYQIVNDPEDIPIRHGLFTDSTTIIPYTDLAMLGSVDSDINEDIVKVYPGYNSTRANSMTTVTIASDTPFFGKVIGEVSFTL